MNSKFFMRNCGPANADLFMQIVPKTDDVRDLSMLCLVNKDWKTFMLDTPQGRKIWLDTASRLTGFTDPRTVLINCSDFWHHLKLLVCPWFSTKKMLHFEIPDCDDTEQRELMVLDEKTMAFSTFQEKSDDGNTSDDDSGITIRFPSDPNLSLKGFETKMAALARNTIEPPLYDDKPDEQMYLTVYNKKIIPTYEHKDYFVRFIHAKAFAVLAATHNANGIIYFMSSRDSANPRFLTCMEQEGFLEISDTDLKPMPKKLYILVNDGVVYMGPTHESTPLICDEGRPLDARRAAPAFWMAGKGDTAGAIGLMKQLGLDINTPSVLKKQTLVSYAISGNQPETLKHLIAAGADINKADYESITPIVLASSLLRVDCVKVLCEAKVTLPVMSLSSVKKGDPRAVINVLDLLIKAKADPNERNKAGRTILFRPEIIGEPTVLRFLIENKADPRLADLEGNTILHTCINVDFERGNTDITKHANMAVMRTIVNVFGIDVNTKNTKGETALHVNIFKLSTDEIKFMVEELKLDLTIKNNNGRTVLQHYKKLGDQCIARPMKFGEVYAILSVGE
jgi:ankyrin repeat protein